jgi:hypothetical protein
MTKVEQHKHCYGAMFHDSLHFSVNEKMQGRVFSFQLDSAGLTRSTRTVQSDVVQWDDCLACPEFDHCYKFCMAKLALETAISKN